MNYIQNINEFKNIGILYHFLTEGKKLDYIVRKGFKIKFSEPDLTFNQKNYISTTRKSDYDWGPIRLVLDGN